jgi:ABC-2 type transport system ATP-binding protein
VIVKGKIVAVDTPENLKAVVQSPSIVGASFNHPMESSTVKQLDALGQVEIKGNMIRIQAKNASETIKMLVHFAEEQGWEIVYMSTVRPSLEDAFVRLTGVEPEVMKMEKERRGGQG